MALITKSVRQRASAIEDEELQEAINRELRPLVAQLVQHVNEQLGVSVEIDTDYTIPEGVRAVRVDATTGNKGIILPPVLTSKMHIAIGTLGGNTVVVVPSDGDTVDGTTLVAISSGGVTFAPFPESRDWRRVT